MKITGKVHRTALVTIFLLTSGWGCATTPQKSDKPTTAWGPGQNLTQLLDLMKSTEGQRQVTPPATGTSTLPSPGDGGPGAFLKQMVALMEAPSAQRQVMIPVPGASASPSPVEPLRDEPVPSMDPLPAIPSALPATETPPLAASTGTGEGSPGAAPEAAAFKPKEREKIRGTVQPATPRVETAALTLRLSPPANSDSLRSRGEILSAEQPYRIGPEDVIKVDVWEEKNLTVEVSVRPDGGISLPLINYVQAAGLTPMELANDITMKLRAYYKAPQVTVIVTQINASKIYVTGNVRKPGYYPLRQEMTVLQGLSQAGGFTEFASPRSIKIIGAIGTNQEIRKVNFYRMIEEAGKGNYILKPGDTIVVP